MVDFLSPPPYSAMTCYRARLWTRVQVFPHRVSYHPCNIPLDQIDLINLHHCAYPTYRASQTMGSEMPFEESPPTGLRSKHQSKIPHPVKIPLEQIECIHFKQTSRRGSIQPHIDILGPFSVVMTQVKGQSEKRSSI